MPQHSKAPAARLSTVEEAASGSEDDLASSIGIENQSIVAMKQDSRVARGTAAKSAGKGSATSAGDGRKRKAAAITTAGGEKKRGRGRPRAALKDRTNLPDEQSDHENEGADFLDDRARTDGHNAKAKRARTAAANPAGKQQEARAKTAAKHAADDRHRANAIAETQPHPEEDVSLSIEVDPEHEMDVAAVPTPPQVQRFAQRPRSASVQPPLLPRASARSASTSMQPPPLLQPRPSARAASVQPATAYPPPRERSGSISDTARGGRRGANDPELRRKLNDLTKKYEDLNTKYQTLQEIGRGEAESNFEKLRRATEQRSVDANDLIASLKKEVAELKGRSSSEKGETVGLQKQVAALTAKNADLVSQSEGVKGELQTAQNEAKALEAKLVAARQQISNSAGQDHGKTAGGVSAKDMNRSIGPNATEAQKEAKMKENLYSDLTGLIIRGVKQKDAGDEYDCIQTGRNGTLHFHLTVANDRSQMNPQTPSGMSWEDAEFAYDPLLDESRDRDLIDLLPEYLSDGIYFPRHHAVKFFTTVVESMTKRIQVVEE